MGSDDAERTHNGVPVYRSGRTPKHLLTARQLDDSFDLVPTGDIKGFVDSQYGLVALYQVNETRLSSRAQ